MSSLVQTLSQIVGEVFVSLDLPAELGAVRVSDRPDLAQFQCNGAMAAAKQTRKNPRAVAEEVVAKLSGNPLFSKVEIAGPGFINLNITNDMLAGHLTGISQDDRCGVALLAHGETVVLDYGGMNVAKAMHVGHLRPNVIGDALKRMVRFAGYNALGDIHMGDWGLPMGQIISEFALRNPEWVYFDANFTGPYPEEAPFVYSTLEEIYPLASLACKEDADRLELARQATADLQNGRPGYRALWQHFMKLSIADLKKNTDALGVHFEIWKGEADVNDLIPAFAEELKAKGLLVESDGAQVIEVAEEGDKKEVPPLMFFKSNGAQTYGTTDLATLYERVKLYPDLVKVIYVTDKRQNLHFEQVFRAAKKAHLVDKIELVHIGFGTLNGADGKPFKTRDGGVMRFDMLLDLAKDKAAERMKEANLAQDLSEQEWNDTARMIGVAAIKFADLLNQAHVDYIFDIDQMTSFEGKTGPYILYQAVRIKSLLRKAGEVRKILPFQLQDGDRALALLMTQLPEVFANALKNYTPHVLCEYAHRLAQEFSSFYGNCHILSETDEGLKQSRLHLCRMALAQLTLLTGLMGIDIPERM